MKRELFIFIASAFVAVSSVNAKNITIKKLATAPVIDGMLEDAIWGAATSNVIKEAKGEVEGFEASFKMFFDDDYIYVAVTVKDPTPNIIGASPWQSDGVEIFFAMDTSNSEVYRPDDWQFRKMSAKSKADGGIDGSSNVTAQIIDSIKVAQVEGDSYIQEWAFPWNLLLKDINNFDSDFRFDIQCAQANETAAGRVGQIFWNSSADDQYCKVKSQGLVTIECHCHPFPDKVEELKNEISIFPNPVRKFLNIKSPQNFRSYEVYNLSNMFISKKQVHSGDFHIDMSNFVAGEYIVRFYSENGTVTNKLIVKQ